MTGRYIPHFGLNSLILILSLCGCFSYFVTSWKWYFPRFWIGKKSILFRPFFQYSVICHYNCCGASGASEQQHKQDLRRIYKGRTNSRNHHFLPECYAAFYQNTLCLLPECIAPRTTRGCDTVVMASCLCVDCSWDRLVVMVCFDLHVKRCEQDRAWLSQPLLLSSMQN